MQAEIGQVRPVVDKRDGAVVAWCFRLTARLDDGASGFDDLELPCGHEIAPGPAGHVAVPEPLRLRRPLDAWTRREVTACLQWATAHHPRALKLFQIVEARSSLVTLDTFTMDQLRN